MSQTKPPFPSFTKTWHTAGYSAINPQRPELSVKGKNIIITGGGSGIGAATAVAFAEAGASSIAILGRTESKLVETRDAITTKFPSISVHVIVVDVADSSTVQAAFSAFAAKLSEGSKVHVLINCAAYVSTQAAVDSVDFDLDDRFLEIDTNFKGVVVVAHHFSTLAAPDAVIIDVSSFVSFAAGPPGYTVYAASKAAAVRFYDYLALEKPGFRVYHVHPGSVDTAMSRKNGYHGSDDASLPANFMVWLASAEATFAKGKYLFANWDVDELKVRAEEMKGTSVLTTNLVGWPFDSSV